MEAFVVNLSVVLPRLGVLLSRTAGLMITAPLLGGQSIPPRVRVLLALAVSMALYPSQGIRTPSLDSEVAAIVAVATEFVTGALLGFTARLIYGAVEVAGFLLGFQMGMSLSNVIDPASQAETQVVAVFQTLVASLMLLAVNGHHWFLLALRHSFELVPPLASPVTESAYAGLLVLTGRFFQLGIQLAAPAIVITLMVDVVLMLIGRAAPQMPVMIVGMPAKLVAGMVALLLFVQWAPRNLGALFAEVTTAMEQMIGAMGIHG